MWFHCAPERSPLSGYTMIMDLLLIQKKEVPKKGEGSQKEVEYYFLILSFNQLCAERTARGSARN